MTFLVDNQQPPALARFIESDLGAKAMHVSDVELRDASDAEVWRYASLNGLIVISKDEDFADMLLQRPAAKLIWVRIGNCRRAYLLEVFGRIWPRIMERFKSGDLLVEVR